MNFHFVTDSGTLNDIWISPSEYEDQRVLLVTTSDITKRLETEQELIQAGKMATLGEMSTGIAHELNQPLSVIKTASDFIIKKVEQKAQIANLADFCNECGNCDTFCPEVGGPYIEKPRFFFNEKAY